MTEKQDIKSAVEQQRLDIDKLTDLELGFLIQDLMKQVMQVQQNIWAVNQLMNKRALEQKNSGNDQDDDFINKNPVKSDKS